MILFVKPEYQPQNWHSYLLYVGLILITCESTRDKIGVPLTDDLK